MKISCETVQSLLPDALRGGLDESARAGVLAHTGSCPDCARDREFAERIQSAIADDPLAAPPSLYFEGVLAEIHARMPASAPRSRTARRFRLQPQAAASCCMLLLFCLWLAPLAGPAAARVLRDSRPPAGSTHAAARTAPFADRESMRPPRLVAVAQVGLVAEGSYLLEISADFRRDIGYLPVSARRAVAAAAKKG